MIRALAPVRLFCIVVAWSPLLAGCHPGVLDPAGPVAAGERTILLNSLVIMLAIVIPVIVLTLGFAWWFRAGNTRADYRPDWTFSGRLELLVWSVPLLVVIFLAGIAWIGSHTLDPARPLESKAPPLEVQVVAMDWKWLFIYPGQSVASVNRLVLPTGTPVRFRITSATVMNSFFVPQLGGQVYAMAGMEAKLNLQADRPGRYRGLSAHYSGAHFGDMAFPVDAMPPAQFAGWVNQTRASPLILDGRNYMTMLNRLDASPQLTFGRVAPNLFIAALRQSTRPPREPVKDGREQGMMFGKLGWDSIPLDEPIPMIAALAVMLVLGGVLFWTWKAGHWPYLWREWITSVDHKKIGIMYCIFALVMLLRGFADALMMRAQQAMAMGSEGYLPPDHYDQIFTAHGTIMIFFVAMPFMIGLMNFALPLQLGVRDVAFPTLNNVSFWLTAAGAFLIQVSLVVGEFAKTGWVVYPPLSELPFSPGVGVDYYIWALQISGVGTLLSGVNLVTTILKLRAPGMSYTRMPMFCWTSLATNLLIVAAFPILTATLAMLALDRYLGFHFFTNDAGGNAMMFVNLIWAWGHPEVYILILPAFGIFSEVVSTFSSKPLFGYRSMVIATMAICILSFMVWLHHFFTMGADADVNGFFGVMTMIIAVPTGAKIFNWLFTMYRGRVRFTSPMLWAIGFMVTFVIGGMTGVLLAVPPADFVLHNSLFLVAHFHNVVIGGVLFGAFAGYSYWFPKAFGFRLHEGWGKAAFWCWLIGFYLAFMPLYVLGLQGMTRRLQHYDVPEWQPWLIVAALGALTIFAGILCQIAQLYVSIRQRHDLADKTGDPWDGRTLEWMTTSPPPYFNFAALPNVEDEEAYWDLKEKVKERRRLSDIPDYAHFEMPKDSPTGVISAFFATVLGFAMVWHIWWLVILGFLGAWATFVVFAWRDEPEYEVSAEEAQRIDAERRRGKAQLLGLPEEKTT